MSYRPGIKIYRPTVKRSSPSHTDLTGKKAGGGKILDFRTSPQFVFKRIQLFVQIIIQGNIHDIFPVIAQTHILHILMLQLNKNGYRNQNNRRDELEQQQSIP